MGIANDIISRTDTLAADRMAFESEWKTTADYFLPSSSREMAIGAFNGATSSLDRLVAGPASKDNARKRYDSTAISALDRLSAGMESLVSPQSEKWHTQAPNDPLAPEPTDEEAKWFERLRDYQFGVRYSPLSGFGNANQKYIRSIVCFGTGIIFTEEAFGRQGKDQRQLPALYQHIPVSQALIALNAQGNPDTLHRRFPMTARQMVQKFKDKVSAKVKEAADDVKKQDTYFDVIHAVCPRDEAGQKSDGGVRGSRWASYYIEVDGAHLIGTSGYFEFPFAIGYWIQPNNAAYGESPAMVALDDVRGLNASRKSGLTSMQQWLRPSLGVAHDGVMNRPNLNSGAINFGAVDSNGRPKIVPLHTVNDPSMVQKTIEDQRNQVRELLYNNLFQILIQNPQMTAHEAMLRAAEKGDLLGPNGVKIQQGYAVMSDREVGIIERKGAFRPGASLEPPASLRGRSFGARFTSELDRMRSQKESAGILQTYSAASQIAQLRGNPAVLDNLDDDISIKIIADSSGAPQRIIVNKDARDAKRKVAAEQLAQAQQAAQAEQMAKTAKDAVPAIQGMNDMAQGGGGANVAPVQLPSLPSLSGMPA
jgi:hypothetical protein